MNTLLIVDDEPNIRNGLQQAFADTYQVITAEDGKAALTAIEEYPVDVAIVDIRMPNIGGLELLDIAKKNHPHIPIILLTGHGTIQDAVTAMHNGAYDFLTKPVNIKQLEVVLARAVEHTQLIDQNRALRTELADLKSFSGIVTRSPAMTQVIEVAQRAARSDATILITGESGVGKEVLADIIYQHSMRNHRPFVKVNAAALSDTLLESELFGHEKGAFTGAVGQRKGRFELADGGTIFLDEIGEMDMTTQVKLLRVLQQQTIERVGGEATIKIDVRIIAATNQNLEHLIKHKKFREDLYYRINVIGIEIPPLRNRVEDIPLLVQTLATTIAQSLQLPHKHFTPECMHYLTNYAWPGNVRQLRNVIESALVLSRNQSTINASDLPPQITNDSNHRTPSPPAVQHTPPPSASAPLASNPPFETLDQHEKHYIERVLQHCNGNKSRAAAMLGVQRATLYNKLNRHGIE